MIFGLLDAFGGGKYEREYPNSLGVVRVYWNPADSDYWRGAFVVWESHRDLEIHLLLILNHIKSHSQ